MNELQKMQLKRLLLILLMANMLPIHYYQNLWTSFVFGSFKYFNLIELRDLSEGYLSGVRFPHYSNRAEHRKEGDHEGRTQGL